jgi:lipoyl(octanoyl) transferase
LLFPEEWHAMTSTEPTTPEPKGADGPVLQAYLLGTVEFEAALALQKFLVYQTVAARDTATLLLCEHPPLITVGRLGSRAHILCEPEELVARRWQVRWVNRGGGCVLHTPGQHAVYAVLALDRFGLGVQGYLDRVHQVLIDVLDDFSVRGQMRPGRPGVWAQGRLVAEVGVAVRDWVAYFGAYFNINPDLELMRRVRAGGADEPPMTSLERERRGPLRPSLVRERLLEHFATRFGFPRTALFSDHPQLRARTAPSGTVPAAS